MSSGGKGYFLKCKIKQEKRVEKGQYTCMIRNKTTVDVFGSDI